MLGFDLSNYLEQNKPTNDPMNNIYKALIVMHQLKGATTRYAKMGNSNDPKCLVKIDTLSFIVLVITISSKQLVTNIQT